MILTFVFDNHNAVTVTVNLMKRCDNMKEILGYVVVYWTKKSPEYCEYK